MLAHATGRADVSALHCPCMRDCPSPRNGGSYSSLMQIINDGGWRAAASIHVHCAHCPQVPGHLSPCSILCCAHLCTLHDRYWSAPARDAVICTLLGKAGSTLTLRPNSLQAWVCGSHADQRHVERCSRCHSVWRHQDNFHRKALDIGVSFLFRMYLLPRQLKVGVGGID